MEKDKESQDWKALQYQDELSRSAALIRGIIGGNRTGKTEWGAKEASSYLLGTHPYRNVSVPSEIWIGTPSFDTQVESAQPKLLKFIRPEMIEKIEYYQGNKIKTIYLKNGSKVTFKSYEQATDKWAGAEKRLIWFDEEPPHAIWTEAVVRQGRDVPLDMIFTLTPVNGLTWFYDEIWLQKEAKGIEIKTPRWEDNPYLTAEQIATMESMLTTEELEVRKYGRFVRGVGLVCSWWRRDLHVQRLPDGFDPKGGTIYVGIDFGFTTSSTAVIFISIKGDDVYIFDGIYEKGLTTPHLAQRLKEKLGGLYVTRFIADSAASSDIEELKNYGFAVDAVKKEVGSSKDNWDEFRAKKLMELGQPNAITGRSRLHISDALLADIDGRTVHWFANEAENLRWKTIRSADGNKSLNSWSNEKPKDAIDALSYILVSLPMSIDVKYTNNYERKSQVPKDDLFNEDGFYL